MRRSRNFILILPNRSSDHKNPNVAQFFLLFFKTTAMTTDNAGSRQESKENAIRVGKSLVKRAGWRMNCEKGKCKLSLR